METHAERRFRERAYVFPGLIGSHIALFFLASWYLDGLLALLSLRLGLVQISALLGLVAWYFANETFRQAQAHPIRRPLAINTRFDESRQQCNICQLVAPMRTKHCKTCGVCCERFDHHCTLLGVCVGRFNHAHFIAMLVADVMFLVTTLLMLLFGWFVQRGIVVPFMVFLLILATACPAGLLVFHLYMITSNQTTWEWLSRDRIYYLTDLDEEILPFDLGCFGNLKEFFFKMHKGAYLWNAPEEVYHEDYDPPQNCCNNKHYSCF